MGEHEMLLQIGIRQRDPEEDETVLAISRAASQWSEMIATLDLVYGVELRVAEPENTPLSG
jgi:hypothetical protein